MKKIYYGIMSFGFKLYCPEAQELSELLDDALTKYVFNEAFERWYNINSDKVSALEYQYRQAHNIYV